MRYDDEDEDDADTDYYGGDSTGGATSVGIARGKKKKSVHLNRGRYNHTQQGHPWQPSPAAAFALGNRHPWQPSLLATVALS